MDTEITTELDMAKSYINDCHLGDDFKKLMLNLLNTSFKATNGVSQNEKIQLMTESICGLVQAISIFSTRIDGRIKTINDEQCSNCQAKSYYKEQMNLEKHKELLEKQFEKDSSWIGRIFSILEKPWIWILLIMSVFAPNTSEIVKALSQIFSR